jgi:exosortase
MSRHISFGLIVALTSAVFWDTLTALLRFAFREEQYSHIVLIPLISAWLFYLERSKIFIRVATQWPAGSALVSAGALSYWLGQRYSVSFSENDRFAVSAFALVLVWIAAFVLSYGLQASRAALFPLLFLFLIVPLPDIFLARAIHWLQIGSAEVTHALFQWLQVPVFRTGLVFALPGVTIEIAEECSGIRSSLALFITSLLAGHLLLRSPWGKAMLILAALPLLVLKNGIRIVTLSLLAIYVDPSFLAGPVHRQGGVLFLLLVLAILAPVLLAIRRLERTWTVPLQPRGVATILAVLAVLAGCSSSPEAQKARYLERANKYFAGQQYREAAIEYQNALRLDAGNVQAVRNLGLAHYHLGEIAPAFQSLRRAKELDPTDVEVRQRLGNILLLGGQPAPALQEAVFILDRDPRNLDALVLLAGAARGADETEAAIRRLEAARADIADRAAFHVALGGLHLRKHDLVRAESAFREAVAREPKSVEVRLALGTFYAGKRDLLQAERELKTAVDLAPAGSLPPLVLANFYLQAGRADEGKQLLGSITQTTPEFLPAWRRIAEIATVEGRHDDAAAALQTVLTKRPSDPEGLLLRGTLRLAQGETAAAVQDFQHVLKLEPRLAVAHYRLGLAQLRAGNIQQARAALNEALSVDPRLAEARLLSADLDLRTGAAAPAIEALQKLLATEPRNVKGHLLLGLAHLSRREPEKALEAYRKIIEVAPKDPRGPYSVGVAFLAQGKRTEAQREFEAALALAPAFLDPLARLVSIAIAEKRPDGALERVTKQVAAVPGSAALHVLLGDVQRIRGDLAAAEAAYLKALELESRLIAAYLRLGDLYARQGGYDRALTKLEGALSLDPRHLAALTLSGVIYERRANFARAEEAYGKALAVDSRFAPAANNLAYLLTVRGGDKERALQLARTAKEAAPDDPNVSDTLGWVLYQRGAYETAFALLKESATRLPENPEYQYHLGMAALKVGDRQTAKRSLTKATIAGATFVGRDEAERILAQIR